MQTLNIDEPAELEDQPTIPTDREKSVTNDVVDTKRELEKLNELLAA